ncbi:MAG: DUF488 family protein [Actinomycetales bacterium]|nr:DUF488 family protein [Actinomycetales bacterium]
MVRVARVYDERSDDDGLRVLVDRLWPRGVRKDAGAFDEWLRDVAPSDELRHWYAHDPSKHEEFLARYLAELESPERVTALEKLHERVADGPVTLVTATKELTLSHAEVLAGLLDEPGADGKRSSRPPG